MGEHVTRQDLQLVAAWAGVDVRSVRRALEGARQSVPVRRAIAAGLRKYKFVREAAKVEKAGAT